jgi:hypothetical protein
MIHLDGLVEDMVSIGSISKQQAEISTRYLNLAMMSYGD